ncbi:MAG: ATP-dependent Clp protease ATP-binding subunit [Phycisphaerae bacterium]|nr:ATP-dependent Clp protease ATP-binding subunit [Phycisphaerae bacterium]
MDISPSMRITLGIAGAEARLCGNASLEPEHLFLGICKLEALAEAALMFPEVGEAIAWLRKVLEDAGLSCSGVRRRLRALMRKADYPKGKFTGHRSERCVQVCEAAEELAREEDQRAVSIRHFMTALIVDASPVIREVIVGLDGRWTVLREAVGLTGDEKGEAAPTIPKENAAAQASPSPAKHPGKPGRASRTPLLDKLGRDVTALAREGKLMPCVGRKDEMRQIAQILRRKTKSNPVLVGDPGVGKTCVVEGLAQRVVASEAPSEIRGWRIVEISMGSLLAGTCLRGEFEQRLQILIREAGGDPNVVLFVDELHTMVGAGKGSEQGMDAAQILKPALARGEIKVIGATTNAEYRRYIESDAALERRFQMVWVNEPSKQEAIEILTGLKGRFEEHHGLVISDNAVAKAVELSMRYMPDHRLPDKAIDLIDQACSSRMLATLSFNPDGPQANAQPLDAADIAKVVAERCRVPAALLTTDERIRLEGMEDALKQRVIGQDNAVREAAAAVRSARLGLADPRRPAGVFLFLGPTGVGKTELAKALAEFLFGSEDALIRFDMSEYKEKHEVAKLIGAPPGYVGYHDEGQLVSKVRTRPYAVILFDEIEKAHPEVYDVFLQVFDEGRLTDGKGRRADFSECIIIMTSNLGCRRLHDQERAGTGFGFHPPREQGGRFESSIEAGSEDQALAQAVLSEVSRHFRPEFLNRVRKQVVFRPLGRKALEAILSKLIDQLNARLRDKTITVCLSPEARQRLLNEGYDEIYGARALERVFEKQISERLAAELLKTGSRGGYRLLVAVAGEDYVVTKQ